jgi:PST family polysaccharide transporter
MGIQALWLAALIPILIAFVHPFGIAGVAAGHVVVGLLVVIPVFLWSLAKVGIAPMEVARAVQWSFLGGIAVAVTAWATFAAVGNGLVGVLLAGTAGLLVYTPVLLPFRHHLRTRREVPEPPVLAVVEQAGV